MEMNHPFLRWLRRVLANFCAFMLFPLMLSAAYLLDRAYLVVRDFRVITQVVTPEGGIARQQWRARIETRAACASALALAASPASNGGRGLKLDFREQARFSRPASPASNGGRGLKHMLRRHA